MPANSGCSLAISLSEPADSSWLSTSSPSMVRISRLLESSRLVTLAPSAINSMDRRLGLPGFSVSSSCS
ncbi:MAG: hypothetical protein FWG74_08235 [Planctomycetes bacterium]|nr:hypothetical protein [Planctomycetota bacterium]